MTLNSTYQVDLPEHGILGSLLIKVEGANMTGHGQNMLNWRVLDNIISIEVLLNGATICKSLTGRLAQAIAFYDNGVVAPDLWRHYATNTQYGYFLIDFGRYLMDPQLGLDLSKYKNVELRITNNAAAATEFSALTTSILGFYLREPSAGGVQGHIRSEVWRTWTTVQDATEYLDLPTEYPIKRILLQTWPNVDANWLNTTGFSNLADDVELSLDTGVVRVYKGGMDEIAKSNLYEYGRPVITGGEVYALADDGIETGVGNMLYSAHGAGSADDAAAAVIPTFAVTTSNNRQELETYEGDSPIRCIWGGDGYHNTVVFRFDYDENPASWLDPKARATVEMNVHTRNAAASAGGTNRVVLERLVR